MHCPGCGTEAPLTQKFCRSCGFNLEKVPQLVAEQLSESQLVASNASKALQKRQREIERWLSVTGIGFTVLVALSMLVGLIYLVFAGSIPMVPGIILLVLVLGGIAAGSLGIYSERLKKKLSDRTESLKSLPDAGTTSLTFEPFDGPFLSVTERTTNLLDKNNAVEVKKELKK